ncbi:MAG TPA: bifunctional methylenetetrahydrofolate dehydrogenase/methenyltetrahydrofolate cyclohydrolase [Polyangiaceae bacterium]|nr:bifunctional methylenetetrahydrofolate dehydrogenase/methenyltetrahydrofolate cyclohydrolase [Polyangiaceae bacterium]
MTKILDPAEIAASFRSEIRSEIAALPEPIVLRGFLGTAGDSGTKERGPSHTYAEYTRKGCDDVGVRFDLVEVPRLEIEHAIEAANADAGVHGILVYYPVFGTEQDAYLRELVLAEKDIEGLHRFWARCLYENRRYLDAARTKKAILPCTPLAVLKLLDAAGAAVQGQARPLAGKRAVVFNRSEVVGRPLAAMLANDGATVTSFDIDGPLEFAPGGQDEGHVVRETRATRASALAAADIVVTGVPSKTFPKVTAAEIQEGAVCVNFSTQKNFDDSILGKASVFIPRVGPMTVTMALRNTVRLYLNARTSE